MAGRLNSLVAASAHAVGDLWRDLLDRCSAIEGVPSALFSVGQGGHLVLEVVAVDGLVVDTLGQLAYHLAAQAKRVGGVQLRPVLTQLDCGVLLVNLEHEHRVALTVADEVLVKGLATEAVKVRQAVSLSFFLFEQGGQCAALVE